MEEKEQPQGEQEPRASDFTDYDQFTAAVAQHAARQAVRQAVAEAQAPKETPAEKAERERYEAAIDPSTGQYRSLAHLHNYVGSPLEVLPGGPNPTAYGPDDEDRYAEDLRAFKTGREVAKALRPAPELRLTPFEDDQFAGQRREIGERIHDLRLKAMEAKRRSETKQGFTEKDFDERADAWVRALDKLPPRPSEVYAEEQRERFDSGSVDLLYDEKLRGSPQWDDPRLAADAPVLVAKVNEVAKTTLRLPLEQTPFGEITPCRPENMCTVELSPAAMERWKALVYRSGDAQDADSIFRRSWAALHRLGFASSARRAFPPSEAEEGGGPEEPKKEKPGRSLESMSFKQYESYMNKREQDAKRFQRAPILPPRKGGK
jgi:hypothetical protein